MAPRRIVHIDMDAFYASIEQRDHPELRGRPVAVGGRPEARGVVAAASYEARAFGIHSAMAMARAVRLCPSLVIVAPDFAKYRAVSQQIFRILQSVTPLVEPLSLDEAYLDVTENAWGELLGCSVARRLKALIRAQTGLTASAGVAPNKFLAKIASSWRKPDGLTVIPPEKVESFLQKLPVEALWGVGPRTAARLRAVGIARLVDVRTADLALLTRLVGRYADTLRRFAYGLDERAVEPERPRKSIGSECTYPRDLLDEEEMRAEVETMARELGEALDRHRLAARTVTIKVRYADFTTVTRSQTTARPTPSGDELAARAGALLARTEAGRRAVRLLGVSVHNLLPLEAADLDSRDRLPFEDPPAEPPQ